jgi:tetratricopeptide (TPR) repeat protein
MHYDNLTICYQGIQRVYRNAVVGYIRRQLNKEYPETAESELTKPFQKEWKEIEAAARQRRDTGEIASPLKDAFDILGVNHFFSLFESQFDKLCPAKAAASKEERRSAQQALLGWLKVIKNFRDPLSHPAEIDFDDDDARNMLYNARKVLDFLHLTDEAKELIDLSREFDKDTPSNISIVYLPPPDEVVVDFVGRTDEVRHLDRWLDDPLSKRWALSGDGGKGKSAIAYSFARSVVIGGHKTLDAVIWLSAKVRRFIAGSTITVDRPDFTDLESSLKAILRAYGWNVPPSIEEKKAVVLSLLNELPALLIIDDIDTIKTAVSDAILFLLFDVPAITASRVLITSRKIHFGLDVCTTPISGFNKQDARDFIESRAKLFGLKQSDLLKHADRLIDVTDASPLYIEDLLRLVRLGVPVTEAIGVWKKKSGEAAREYSIRREFDELTEDAQKMLLALSIFEGPCTIEQLRAALDWNVERIIDAQQDLRKLYLMPSFTGEADSQKLVLNTNTSLLVQNVFKKDESFGRIKRAVDAVAGKLSPSADEQQTVERELRRITTTVTRSYGDKNALEKSIETLKELNERWPSRADIHGTLGWVYKRMGLTTDARETYRRAHELGSKDNQVYWHWSTLEAEAEEWSEAARIAELGCKVNSKAFDLRQQLGYCLSRAGQQAYMEGDETRGLSLCKKAENTLLKAAGLLQLEKRHSVRSRYFRSLVLTAHSMKDGKVVNKYLLQWRQDLPTDSDFEFEYDRLRQIYSENIKPREQLSPITAPQLAV